MNKLEQIRQIALNAGVLYEDKRFESDRWYYMASFSKFKKVAHVHKFDNGWNKCYLGEVGNLIEFFPSLPKRKSKWESLKEFYDCLELILEYGNEELLDEFNLREKFSISWR